MRIHRKAYCTYIEHYELEINDSLVEQVNNELKKILVDNSENIQLTTQQILDIYNGNYYDEDNSPYNLERTFKYSCSEGTYHGTIANWLEELLNDWLWEDCYDSEYVQVDYSEDLIED